MGAEELRKGGSIGCKTIRTHGEVAGIFLQCDGVATPEFMVCLMQQVIGIYFLYSPIGLHLPMAPGWAYLLGLASAVIVAQLIFANLWMRWFASGPLEWIWRSLAYCRKQPFRRTAPTG